MNREARAAFALIGLLLLTVGIYMLNNGILVSTQLHLVSHRDPQSNRIINEPVRVCRYLHLTGIADIEPVVERSQTLQTVWLGVAFTENRPNGSVPTASKPLCCNPRRDAPFP